jgi:hypothetical protein
MTAVAVAPARPPVCATCWNVHRAAKPRPLVLYCHHKRVAATQTADGWRVIEDVDRADADWLRAKAATARSPL